MATLNVGSTVRRVGIPNAKPMLVLEVGVSKDNKGVSRPAVRCARLADLAAEERGDVCPIWGDRPFKADRYWYLLSEISI